MLLPTILSNNILQRGFNEGVEITPMKLQKLLYFIASDYAKENNMQLFSEPFEVWQYGPVLPSVYGEFKSFGGKPILEYSKIADGSAKAYVEEQAPKLTSIINNIWEQYKGFSGQSLSAITHKDHSGWSNAFYSSREKLTLEDMKADETYR
jgi:Uncharacterized phage-associated protein